MESGHYATMCVGLVLALIATLLLVGIRAHSWADEVARRLGVEDEKRLAAAQSGEAERYLGLCIGLVIAAIGLIVSVSAVLGNGGWLR